MAHYVIYLPKTDRAGVNPTLADVGLSHLLDRGKVIVKACQSGPDDNRGQVVCWEPGHNFHPDQQDWIPAIADPDRDLKPARYWVGIYKASPPTPGDLARDYQFGGQWIKLGDGREWLVPNAERLPHDMIRADDGSTKFIPQRRVHQFALAADYWRQTLCNTNVGGRAIYSELRDFCELGLTANYRLIPEIADQIGPIWNTETVLRVAFAATLLGTTEPRGVSRGQ